MADKKIVLEWLKYADEDFNFASVSLKEQNNFYSRICFFFQQAGEKYLKAYIIANSLPFKKIHDLTQLVKICQAKDQSFCELIEEGQFLTDFYIDTRYPAFWPVGETKKDAEKAQGAALEIGTFVKEKINYGENSSKDAGQQR